MPPGKSKALDMNTSWRSLSVTGNNIGWRFDNRLPAAEWRRSRQHINTVDGQGSRHKSQPVHSSSITVCINLAAPIIASTGQA